MSLRTLDKSSHCRGSHDVFFVTLLLLAFLLLCEVGASEELTSSSSCTAQNRTVQLPVRVHLLFANAAPPFMQEQSWTTDEEDKFLKQLSGVVRHPTIIPLEQGSQNASFGSGPLPDGLCSVVEYLYEYHITTLPIELLPKLDEVLSVTLEASRSMFAPGTDIADKFWQILKERSFLTSTKDPNTYDILIYNTKSVRMQRGYQSENGAPISTFGVASEQRFVFLDTGAEPYFLDAAGTLLPGDVLRGASHEPSSYVSKLHSIVSGLLTPQTSRNMHRFPHENRLVFTLQTIDASAVLGRFSGVAGDSLGNRPVGGTFNPRKFVTLMEAVFENSNIPKKNVTVEVLAPKMEKEEDLSNAVVHAFSMHGLEMVLDTDRLLRDLLGPKSKRPGYFVDSSAVVHVPLYLFSFADDSRITHFETGENLRAEVVGGQALFLMENRLKDELDEHTSLTSEASKGVMQLLYGLDRDTLGYMNAEKGSIPLLLRDIMRRHILAQELDWSYAHAAHYARELLNFKGLDSRLFQQGAGSAIAISRTTVKRGLDQLYKAWDMASASSSLQGVGIATTQLANYSKQLASKLQDPQNFNRNRHKVVLEATEPETSIRGRSHTLLFRSRAIILPVLACIFVAITIYWSKQKRTRAKGTEIPLFAAKDDTQPRSIGEWFRFLTSSNKRKLS